MILVEILECAGQCVVTSSVGSSFLSSLFQSGSQDSVSYYLASPGATWLPLELVIPERD